MERAAVHTPTHWAPIRGLDPPKVMVVGGFIVCSALEGFILSLQGPGPLGARLVAITSPDQEISESCQ